MSDLSNRIVQKLWSYCNVLRDDGLSCQGLMRVFLFFGAEHRLMGLEPSAT